MVQRGISPLVAPLLSLSNRKAPDRPCTLHCSVLYTLWAEDLNPLDRRQKKVTALEQSSLRVSSEEQRLTPSAHLTAIHLAKGGL